MKIHEIFDYDELDEALSRRGALRGLGAALLSPTSALAQPGDKATPTDNTATSHSADVHIQNYIINYLKQHGIEGNELAAFLAQSSTETRGFHELEEHHPKQWFIDHYDIRGNPRKALSIGNTVPGDGERYKGRGFIHLSGKENYQRAEKALNIPLVSKPELAAKPEVAAKTALWYWKTRVQPHVNDWDNVMHVTKQVNPAGWGLSDRTANYDHYKKIICSSDNIK